MMKFQKFAVVAAPALALTMLAAAPADAQSRYRDHDRKDNTAQNAILGAVLGGVAGAVLGNGDGTYVAGGALAGAALGAVASSDNRNGGSYSYGRPGYAYGNGYNYSSSDCGYRRDGRCYRNQGHWERDNGINSRNGYSRDDYRDRRDYRTERRW